MLSKLFEGLAKIARTPVKYRPRTLKCGCVIVKCGSSYRTTKACPKHSK